MLLWVTAVWFRFFSKTQKQEKHSGKKAKKNKCLLRDQSESPPGLQGSTRPVFRGTQRAPTQEPGSVHAPLLQVDVETKGTAKLSNSGRQTLWP